jgi:soluble lytic murein transglycosylase-like protein
VSYTDAIARVAQFQQFLNPTPAVSTAASAANSAGAVATSSSASGTSFAKTLAGIAPGVDKWKDEIDQAARANNIDPALLTAVVNHESGGNPDARSGAGAMGLCQLMPGTAAGLGVTDPWDPIQNLNGGAKLLRQNLDANNGNVALALAAYSAGQGAVNKYHGIPPYSETQNYVRDITAQLGVPSS